MRYLGSLRSELSSGWQGGVRGMATLSSAQRSCPFSLNSGCDRFTYTSLLAAAGGARLACVG